MSSSVVPKFAHLTNRLWRRKHLIFIAIILVSLIITVSYTISDNQESVLVQYSQSPVERYRTLTKRYVPQLRMVHLDLKGAPPKISFLREIFPLLAKAGANGLLLEFEDMFPFDGDLADAAADNAYSKEDVQTINRLAKQNDLIVIPLIQTFGHLESFLKLQKYRHMREVDEFPQAICPSREEPYKLITQIIDQVMAMFPDSKWLHIGCDEVYHIGMCDQCKNKDHDEIFLSHVEKIAKYVKSKHNVNPIIWDDMLRQFSPEVIKKYDFKKLGVEIMVWTYIDDIYRFIPYSTMITYSEISGAMWGASAFKGAFGETLTVPNIKMHLDNNIAWLGAMKEQSGNFQNIRGLVITGWQRYDSLAVLCELLPAGLPSLILNLITVSNGRYESNLLDKFDNLMNCEKNYFYTNEKIFTQDPNFFSKSNCKFPGANVFRLMQEFESVDKKVNDYLYDVTIHKAWLTDYNIRHNISSPYRISEGLQNYYSVMYSLKALLKMATSALSEVYDDFTVYEWIEQKIYPQLIRMESFYNNTLQLQKARVWPKRPLKPLNDLQRFINANNNNNDNGFGN
ncbi:Hydrolase [Tyrophagus putrescentiae]|nr:Hydrolase [Tyrophagus putrescentiae]